MSLADKINQNTQTVLDNKLAIANAIIAKGGTVGTYAEYPSFASLIDGIRSISTGGGGGGDVGEDDGLMLFESIEQMEATVGNEGDIGVVYGITMRDLEIGRTYAVIYLPQTVVFDTANTGTKYVYLNDSSTTSMNATQSLRITSTAIQFCKKDTLLPTALSTVKYTSSDGITYTRTDSLGENVLISDIYDGAYTDIKIQSGNYALLNQIAKGMDLLYRGTYIYTDSEWGVLSNNQDLIITENGTYVPDEGYTGIDTVFVNCDGIKINNSTESTVLANGDISKGDLCSLSKIISEGSFVEDILLPTKLVDYNGSTITVPTSVVPPVVLNDGEIIFISGSATPSYMYPFIKTENGYEQMTINGNYDCITGSVISADVNKPYHAGTAIIYDPTVDIIYSTLQVKATSTQCPVLLIDRANKNLTSVASYRWSTIYEPKVVMGVKGHSFINSRGSSSNGYPFRVVYQTYDPSTNAHTYAGSYATALSSFVGISTLDKHTFAAVDSIQISSTECLVCIKYYSPADGTGSYYIIKCTATDTTLTPTKYATVLANNGLKTAITYTNYTELYTPPITITNSGKVYALDSSNTLHEYSIDFSTLALTEKTLTFSDGLDKTKIVSFKSVKTDGYLFINSSDENYTEDEQKRLYQYNTATGSYEFICCPSLASSPSVSAELPRIAPDKFDSINLTTFAKQGTGFGLYKILSTGSEYEAIRNMNNTIDDSDAYGVAKEDIASGETGTATIIIKK